MKSSVHAGMSTLNEAPHLSMQGVWQRRSTLKLALNAVSLDRGGGLTGLLAYLNAWQMLAVDLDITLFASRRRVVDAVRQVRPDVAIVPFAWECSSSRHFVAQQVSLGREIEKADCDVVMTTNTLVGRCSVPQLVHHRNLKRFLDVQTRVAVGVNSVKDRVKNRSAKRALMNARCNVFISQFMRDAAESVYPASRSRNHVVCNGVAPDLLRIDSDRSGGTMRRPHIVALQDTSCHKDNPTLINMMRELMQKRSDIDWRLTVAGAGDWSQYIRLAESLGVRDRIDFAGFLDRDRVDEFLRNALCLVFTSRLEGFGNPPLEAMARFCPVVASQASAIPEVVGDAGILVAPGRPAEFADAVIRLHEDQRLRRSLIRRGAERIRQFNWLDSAQKMADVLYACASRQPAEAVPM